jgi:AraC family transcriptional regulator
MGTRSLHDLAPSNDPKQVLGMCAASETGLPVTVFPIPAVGEIENDVHPTPRIFVAHQGRGTRCYRRGGATYHLHTAPRMIEIYQAGLEFERESWMGEAGRCVLIEFKDEDVQALTHGELQSLRLQTQHEVFDERLSRHALELAEEVLFGLSSGPLYVQGLSLAILGILSDRYATNAPLRGSSRALTSGQRRRLVDLVAAEFGSKLSLTRLAGEVDLSPHHFTRLFKASFGTTPHDYLQTVRLDAAERALRAAGASTISEIALACGFASQSHLTESMRKRRGTTPSAMRRGAPRADGKL